MGEGNSEACIAYAEALTAEAASRHAEALAIVIAAGPWRPDTTPGEDRQ